MLSHEIRQLQPFLFKGNPVKADVQADGENKPAFLARRIGDAVELIVVNPTRRPMERVRIALDHPITSVATRFDNGRVPPLKEGTVTDRLPPYGVAIYRLND